MGVAVHKVFRSAIVATPESFPMIYIYLALALALTTAGGWVGYRVMDGKVQRAEQATAVATETARLYA